MTFFRPFLFNQEVTWFLLRFVDLVSVYSLLVISKNHSNTFFLTNLQKTKLNQSRILEKGIFFDIRIWTGCFPLPDIFFSKIQINRWQMDDWMTASETHRVSFPRSFFVSLDKSALLCCR